MPVTSTPYVIMGVPAALVTATALTPKARSCCTLFTRLANWVRRTLTVVVVLLLPPAVLVPSILAVRLATTLRVRDNRATPAANEGRLATTTDLVGERWSPSLSSRS